MQWAARSSGLVRLNDPRCDLASGVRLLATMTASLIGTSHKASRSGRAGGSGGAGRSGRSGDELSSPDLPDQPLPALPALPAHVESYDFVEAPNRSVPVRCLRTITRPHA